MKSFEGKVAAVTGAGSGIGRALALALAKRKAKLALSDVDEAGLAETVRLVRDRSGVEVTHAKLDVSKRDDVEAWASKVASDHGGVNLVFNNAGIAYGATVEGSEYEDFERIMNVNFWGVVYGTKAFLPFLRASGEGHVVNISSVFGLIAFPGQCAYNASKFAVRGFTEALNEELEITRAPVRATSVHPGGIKTNIARRAKSHASLADLGAEDPAGSGERFERAFRTTPEAAAETIIEAVRRNKRRVLVGADARALDRLQRFLPSAYQGLIARTARRVLP